MYRAAVLAAGLALAGCAAPAPPDRGAVARLDPQLAEAQISYRFNTCSATIAPAEQHRIRAFLTGLRLDRDDVVIVSIPKGRTPARDAERLRTMRGLLAGIPAQTRLIAPRDFRELPQSEPQGVIRVARTTGVGADCADGSRLGCASGRNLAAMIARPPDTFLPPQTAQRHAPDR